MPRKFVVHLILIAALAAMAVSAFAQNVDLNAYLLNREIKVLFLSDFNFTGRASSGGDIFAIDIINRSTTPQSVRVGLQVLWDGFDGGPIAEGITEPIVLQPLETIHITNQNLFSASGRFSMQDYSIDAAAENLKDTILRTGKLPAGIYSFVLQLLPETSNTILKHQQIDISISNPTTLYLQSPGGPAEMAVQNIFSPFPMFRWISDMDRFRLIVAELLPGSGQRADPQEVIENRVILTKELLVDPTLSKAEPGAETIPSHSYAYPGAGGWALQPGKIYYWQLIGLARSAGQQVELPSEIWSFRLANMGEGSTSSQLMHLLSLLPLGDLDLFGPDGVLAEYEPTGTFLVNGQPMSFEEIVQILNGMNSGVNKVIGVTCE